ncbi:type I polyketide synthase [Sphaerisporangium sp. TRM90804]|uniref:type I polyketide synthase n=1 Tax=Sphaerisporangium sp. TRM90804 TaxID=3031113 RepID=UPI00244CE998|nr:type I polyketide synthase [Sphaerisporangium sp. TRM90804]MDH2427299.1 beta-ketoacyl synthase N-terminal-like domain-containing protein [Sphaerisporangium sp. TRM90804]
MAEYAAAPRPDDVAVVGIGCRLPGGVRTAQALWQALLDGVDVLERVPRDRWDGGFHSTDPKEPGTIYADQGGFLEDIDRFDSDHFGISPREAAEMDPQQRMLLEVTAEAMEDAGVPRHRWQGSRTSVHVGLLGSDYLLLHAKTAGTGAIGPYFAGGKEFSFAAGRIAYTFDLRGPCMTVTTACSSSLTAVHLACRALRDGEVDTALAGGANALVTPELSVFMSKAQALSPTGRCRPFDARADGIARGEGCAVVVLKRYADALRDHDQIHGVILGSAVNHDGHSAGLTVPNALAQQDLLRRALASAGVGADVPQYVEAHGTGTALGDPVELSALAAVLGKGRPPGRPLLVGSLKANFGHTDATAGVIGLLKALLVARHRTVPRQIHFDTPTPLVDWAGSGLDVPVATTPLPGPAVTGVSAFGLSGTNVHVVVRGPDPVAARPSAGPGDADTLLLSASTAAGLEAIAGDHLRTMRDDGLGERLAAAAVRRTHHDHRLAVVGTGAAELREGLEAFRAGREHASAHAGEARLSDAPVVYTFSGHGAQWPGVGMDVYRRDPVFRAALDECDAELRVHSGWALLDVLRDPDPAPLRSTRTGQPALFALQVALARLWSSWGVRPDAVLGHSMGEIAAACVAGALALPEAARLIVERSQALERAKGTGTMASVDLGADQTRERLARWHPEVSVAAVNGPRSVVVSGPGGQVADVVRRLEQEGVHAVELSVEYPSHGPLMVPYGRELRRAVAPLPSTAPTIPFLSTVDVGSGPAALDEAYWERNLCRPVLFWPAVDRLLAEGEAVFVEIGAHPVLTRPTRDALARRGRRGVAVGSLARGESGTETLARSRAELHVAGVEVDWGRVFGGPVRAVALPPPRWSDRRHWLAGVPRGVQGQAPAVVPSAPANGGAAPEPGTAAAAGPGELRDLAHGLLARVLGHPEGTRFPESRGLVELGLDSVSAVEYAEMLSKAAGRPLDAADVLTHATLTALTGHLADLMAEPDAPGEPPADAPAGPEPVAVIGLACRVPGADDADAFWSLLSGGRDAIGPVPPDRWDADRLFAEGATATTRGGFLDSVDGFDHGFFRVSPREARSMDPQHRLFLEVAWEALEHAGLPAEELRDSRTGVFVGLNSTDYQQLVLGGGTEVDLYYGTGNSFSGSAGRLSYLLGLRGPSLAVDTACSSSLTAVHLACQSLRAGESRVAVAGGANVMATPTIFRAMSAAGALSRDGTCKTFDEAADGYGRGEGAGAIVLKRLSDARRDGDRVLCVIRGSAVNQDGASGGLTVPSGTAQQEVIADALRQAGLTAADVDYVEAHGTGTRLGDAIELRALAAALRPGGPVERPLLIGSVKTNIGHLEAAAGIIGLIKVVLSLVHESIPAHLNFEVPTRQVAWDRLALRVPGERVAWARHTGARAAGVSAFGFTGTNAHVVLQEPPAAPAAPRPPAEPGPLTLAVSAKTAPALDAAIARLRLRLAATPEEGLADLCWTSLARRTHHEHRAAVVGRSARELDDGLAAPPHRGVVPAGEPRPVLFHHRSAAPAPEWFAEAGRLLPGIGVAAIVDRIGGELRATGVPGAEALTGHLAITEVWRALGVDPAAVTAEAGLGEYAAAYAAGELTVAEAARSLAAGTPPEPRRGTVPRYRDLAAASAFELVLHLGPDGGAVELAGEPAPHAPDAGGPLATMAALHVRGGRVDWGRSAPPGPRVTSLPGYPWQRARHWVAAGAPAPAAPAPAPAPAAAGEPLTQTALTARIRAMPAPLREEALLGPLLDLVAEVLGGADDDLDPDQGFFGMGMDSVLSLRLKRLTETALGAKLPTTVLFECPNPRSFARFIVTELCGEEDARPAEADDLLDLSDEALADRVMGALADSASVLGESPAGSGRAQVAVREPRTEAGPDRHSPKGTDG